MSGRNLLGLPERQFTFLDGLETQSGMHCHDPGGGAWFGRMAEQSPLTSSEPNSLIEISSQNTPIIFPSRRNRFHTDFNDVPTIEASGDADTLDAGVTSPLFTQEREVNPFSDSVHRQAAASGSSNTQQPTTSNVMHDGRSCGKLQRCAHVVRSCGTGLEPPSNDPSAFVNDDRECQNCDCAGCGPRCWVKGACKCDHKLSSCLHFGSVDLLKYPAIPGRDQGTVFVRAVLLLALTKGQAAKLRVCSKHRRMGRPCQTRNCGRQTARCSWRDAVYQGSGSSVARTTSGRPPTNARSALVGTPCWGQFDTKCKDCDGDNEEWSAKLSVKTEHLTVRTTVHHRRIFFVCRAHLIIQRTCVGSRTRGPHGSR